MSGRRSGMGDDPTSRRALLATALEASEVVTEIRAMLNTDNGFTPREINIMTLRWGLLDGEPKTLGEIGIAIGVTRERARQLERQCLAKLRNRAVGSRLAVINEFSEVVDFVDIRHAGADTSPINPRDRLVRCPQCQQRQFLPSSPIQDGMPPGGRPRKYCSNACRQAAYRARRGATTTAATERLARIGHS